MSKYTDKYTEFELIGRGSYGSAHLVRSKADQTLYVAKKVILANLKPKEQEDSKREVTLLQQLKHPHIVQYIDSFTENDQLIMIMEYCEEGDLQFHINRMSQRKEYFPEKVILNWFLQTALALKYIHEKRILHRDIKSQNIFVTSNGFVKIGDFGISRVLEHTYDQANTVVGTPYYMSPEVCENKPYTYKSDVWALGCVLYELCNLSHAFKSNNLLGLVNRIVREQVSGIPSCYSREMGSLMEKLLIKKADQRPSIQEVLNFPIVRSIMAEFVTAQGQIKMQMPIKRTNTHNEIDKMIKEEEDIKNDDYDKTVQSIDYSQLTPQERMKLKKEEAIKQRQNELTKAAKSNLLEQQKNQGKRVQDLQGNKTLDYASKRQQQQAYHSALQQQQVYKNVSNKSQSQSQSQPQSEGTQSLYDETLVSQYEQTSKLMQSNRSDSAEFKQQLQDYDKTVSSELCESGVDQTNNTQYKITNSQLDRFQEQHKEQQQHQGLSVTQQYAEEQFEEYNSDEEQEFYNNQQNFRLTVKAGESEIQQVLDLYKQNLDQTVKKQVSSNLDEIPEASQESWNSSQAESPLKKQTNEDRIAQLKKQAIKKLGSQLYNQVYSFLSHHLSKETPPDEIRSKLEQMVGKAQVANCMIMDQILYLENINK